MFQPERLATIGFAARRRPNGLVASVMWIAGMIAAVAAMAVGAVLAVFTAAAFSSPRCCSTSSYFVWLTTSARIRSSCAFMPMSVSRFASELERKGWASRP